MDIDDYTSKLRQLETESAANMIALGDWTEKIALPWLWQEFAGAILQPKQKHPNAPAPPLPPVLRPMTPANATRHGLMASVTDRTAKLTDPLFYQAQLTMLDTEARKYCGSIAAFAAQTAPLAPQAIVHTLHRALLYNMRIARVLLEQAGAGVAGVPGYYRAWARGAEHPFEVAHGTRQMIYGAYSGLAFTDRAPYLPVAALRTAIELRLRHAFGIYGLVDPANPGDMVPIDMSKLFDAIARHQSEIDFAVDIHDVWKAYRWSNFYLHGGYRDYPWVPGFVLGHLWPLFADQKKTPSGGGNVDGGIRLKRETWRAVRAELAPTAPDPSIKTRLKNAWAALFPRARRRLELPGHDDQRAQVVFLT